MFHQRNHTPLNVRIYNTIDLKNRVDIMLIVKPINSTSTYKIKRLMNVKQWKIHFGFCVIMTLKSITINDNNLTGKHHQIPTKGRSEIIFHHTI